MTSSAQNVELINRILANNEGYSYEQISRAAKGYADSWNLHLGNGELSVYFVNAKTSKSKDDWEPIAKILYNADVNVNIDKSASDEKTKTKIENADTTSDNAVKRDSESSEEGK